MRNEKGFTLIEIVIAMGILGIIAIAFLGALAGASRAMFVADERATAESLARSQLEYVKDQSYDADWDYTVSTTTWSGSLLPSWWNISNPPLLTNDYSGYEANVVATEITDQAQKITVTIYHNNNPVLTSGNYTLEGYKIDR